MLSNKQYTTCGTAMLPFTEATIEIVNTDDTAPSKLMFEIVSSDSPDELNGHIFKISLPTQFKYEKKHLTANGSVFDIIVHRYNTASGATYGMIIPLDYRGYKNTNDVEEDDIDIIVDSEDTEPSNDIHRPKSYHTQNSWSEGLRKALLAEVSIGRTVDEIFESSQKSKLPYTKYAIEAQIRLMGYGIKKGIPFKKIKIQKLKSEPIKIKQEDNNE